MKSSILILIFLFSVEISSLNGNIDYGPLIWADEFDYNGKPDPNRWFFQNNSINIKVPSYLNSFTDKNAYVENILSGGYLTIVAKKEQSLGMNYSSAGILSTRGFRYGIFEMRAKLGTGRGTWANFVLAPDQRRTITTRGEIDVSEVFDTRKNPNNVIRGTVHYNYSADGHSNMQEKGNYTVSEDPSTTFHTYTMDWNSQRMIWYVDGNPYHTYPNRGSWEFNISYIVQVHLTIAKTGHSAGEDGVDDSIFPVYHLVDYVRVYASPDSNETELVWETIPNFHNFTFSWAPGCDMPGNDLVKLPTTIPCHDSCQAMCLKNSGCTHFTAFNGTCYLKSGTVSRNNAIKGDANMICGIVDKQL